MSGDGIWEVSFPSDSKGMISQQCPVCKGKFKLDIFEYNECDSKYFVCPHCKIKTTTQEFLTEDQRDYLLSIVSKETLKPLLNTQKISTIPPKEEVAKEITACKKCGRKYGLFKESKIKICPYCAYSSEGFKVETELVEQIPEEGKEMKCTHTFIERHDRHGELETSYYCDASDKGRALIGFNEQAMERWCEGCQILELENQEHCVHRSYSYFVGMGMKNVNEAPLRIRCTEIEGRLFETDLEKTSQICSECDYYVSNASVNYRKVSERGRTKKELIEEGTEYIFTFEIALRSFIEAKLKEFYGDKWWKQGVPKDVRDNCEERKEKNEVLYGEDRNNILDFADFTDYRKIVCRKDNWKNIFKPYFTNEKMIDVKLSELEPIRNTVQHNRLVSERDIEKLRIYTEEIVEMIKL